MFVSVPLGEPLRGPLERRQQEFQLAVMAQ
jgi:hypothetical protein